MWGHPVRTILGIPAHLLLFASILQYMSGIRVLIPKFLNQTNEVSNVSVLWLPARYVNFFIKYHTKGM